MAFSLSGQHHVVKPVGEECIKVSLYCPVFVFVKRIEDAALQSDVIAAMHTLGAIGVNTCGGIEADRLRHFVMKVGIITRDIEVVPCAADVLVLSYKRRL